MKVYALLSWYDESATWLAATVASCAGLCDHIIAVDGAYALYPKGKRASDPGQAEAVQLACYANGLGCTIHTPDSTWFGNEVEKRAFMFRLALAVATPEDWFLIMDGDMLVKQPMASGRVRAELEATSLDVAEVTFTNLTDPHASEAMAKVSREFIMPRASSQNFRSLFRALPGLTVEGMHYVYTTVKDGERVFLWHRPDGSGFNIAPALDLTADVELEHRNKSRDLDRAKSSQTYYARRDEHGIERVDWSTYAGDRTGT